MRLPRDLGALAAFLAATCAAADATPTIAQSNGGNGAPTSNLFTSTYTAAPTAGNQGVLAVVCSSTITAPTGWSSIFASNHVGTSLYLAVFGKTLVGSGDQTQSVTCNGANDGYTIYELSNAGIIAAGSLTTSSANVAATGSVTDTVPKSGGLMLEIYAARTQSGTAATGITDSASVSTTASANDGAPGINAQLVYSFVTGATDPFSASQPYTNSGTWNHAVALAGSVDIFIAPPGSASGPAWWPPPFDRIQ